MASENLPRLVIFGDPKKARVSKEIRDFSAFAKGKARITAQCGFDQCTSAILKDADFAVVFGGDGTIISSARQLCGSGVPVIGVNLGKLGFIAEFNVDELKQCFGDIISGKTHIEKRMMLGCRVFSDGKQKFNSVAVNDVFVAAGPPFRAIELKILVDGQSIAGCLSDGLIIATPTGSTAYNLSAGGPILSARMEAMVITPICPHSLSFRSIVINANSQVEVWGEQVNEGTTVSIDGQISLGLSRGELVSIERADSNFLIVNNPLRTQWDTLATKLRWAEKPK